jgi:competence protein ComFC
MSRNNAVANISLFLRAKNLILDAIFPHKCVCGKWGTLLCDDCAAEIRIDKTNLCPLCKRISAYGRTCDACRHKSSLTGVMILGPHKGVLKDLIWKYKYRLVVDVSKPLAGLVCNRFGEFIRAKRFLVTYSPSTKEHMRWRGFNQAQLIAKELAGTLDLECKELLHKDDKVSSQVGHSRKERLQNISGKIKYIGTKKPIRKKILIIDDVYTTGATLEECAKILRFAGYREVWGLVLSRD